ncbi:uncharacterized protein LOC142982406 isoform X2 [Anticarsia gemmatalis]|uniref:uncharacterized protein LOC142982406 isoform X2 n=1 Tax=Anticarsia gemmatalis TaxID=129554 RepID=UPI003F76049F
MFLKSFILCLCAGVHIDAIQVRGRFQMGRTVLKLVNDIVEQLEETIGKGSNAITNNADAGEEFREIPILENVIRDRQQGLIHLYGHHSYDDNKAPLNNVNA